MLSNIIKIISLAVLAVLINLFLTYWSNTHGPNNDISVENKITYDSVVAQIDTGVTRNHTEPPEIIAEAGCVFDLLKKEYLYEKNINAQLPLASITKLMTAVIAKENLFDSTLINISKEALAQDGNSGLLLEESWNLDDIIDVMLVASVNDAAYAIASSLRSGLAPNDTLFVKFMNDKARELSLNQTYYLNATGLDLSDSTAGALGSCKNTVELVKYITHNHPEILEVTSNEKLVYGDREFTNTNKLLGKLPAIYGGKTGFDDLAGGNLVIVVDKSIHHPLIIAVLGSTINERFEDVEKLYKHFAN
ncbi:D-alanyl-D-alanine carboxypeptidase family protein [Patescibacteria group bacterium]